MQTGTAVKDRQSYERKGRFLVIIAYWLHNPSQKPQPAPGFLVINIATRITDVPAESAGNQSRPAGTGPAGAWGLSPANS